MKASLQRSTAPGGCYWHWTRANAVFMEPKSCASKGGETFPLLYCLFLSAEPPLQNRPVSLLTKRQFHQLQLQHPAGHLSESFIEGQLPGVCVRNCVRVRNSVRRLLIRPASLSLCELCSSVSLCFLVREHFGSNTHRHA